METAALKSFATSARTKLLREVSARLAVVLSPASAERIEEASAVAALERAVRAAGGGEAGRALVTDQVAYTWFNRIIALRFMDANGYTGIGVVSPEHGRASGQPEVLAEAKRGNIDIDVVDSKAAVIITSLLNGTKRSDDPQGEAYGLLLAEYCRFWNRSMPFMFEHEGDYTELLIPADLLADDSVMARAGTVLTSEACDDVEVIGWLYQFYISERKDEVFAGFKKNKKAGAAEIPAATQLFTPHWIVRYLVENSLGRLWLLNRPSSNLADQMQYYIAPIDEETDFLKVSSPEDLKLIDPACGSGHMLTYAFDLLYAIYEEEGYAPADIPALILTNNLYGTEIDPRAGSLAAFALTMKARKKQRMFFSAQVRPNVCALDPVRFEVGELDQLCTAGGNRADEEAFWNQFEHADVFGSLIRPNEALIAPLQRHLQLNPPIDLLEQDLHDRANRVVEQALHLSQRHHVVVANPPYMGGGNMGTTLSQLAARDYRDAKSDLFAMFLKRGFELTHFGGYSAMVTMDSWMFLNSFAALRSSLLSSGSIRTMLHMPYVGRGGTSMGISFGTSAVCFKSSPSPDYRGLYHSLRYFESDREGVPIAFPPDNDRASMRCSNDFSALPGQLIAFWVSPEVIASFKGDKPLASLAQVGKGLDTGDNARFLRFWHEVDSRSPKWFPLQKGGPFRKWFGNDEVMINWLHDGRELRASAKSNLRNARNYLRSGISWTKISSGRASFRWFPEGHIFDTTGPAIFADNPEHILPLLSFLNSRVSQELLAILAPTLDYQSGHIGVLPVNSAVLSSSLLRDNAERCLSLSRRDWNSIETSSGFETSPLVRSGRQGVTLDEAIRSEIKRVQDVTEEIRALEIQNNEFLTSLYKLSSVDCDVSMEDVTTTRNPKRNGSLDEMQALRRALRVQVEDFCSYAVGCMFGRYSLDKPGLILANQGDALRDYLVANPEPSFLPDVDNVIPIVDGDWFEDDILARFRRFLRAAFGDQHFEENLRFVAESLDVTDLRDYFVKSFYKDHVQRYKKRPIYWLFSSPKGSFNALIYVHRYTSSTVSTVLNEYLREFKSKLEASLHHEERLALDPAATPRERAAAQRKTDGIRMTLLELDGYEHDVLYPLATQQIEIDLDDGVKVNYPKFGAALKKIPGLEAADE